jgi:diguanylate cyclase (GGDEF)-like protein
MRLDQKARQTSTSRFAWLFAMPPHNERTVRMESLIARLRLVILVLDTALLAWFLDTSHMQMQATWWIMALSFLYAIPWVFLQPYRRWPLLGTSMFSTVLDSLAVAAFIAVTGASQSPFFPLYYLSVAAVAMRFDMRQTVVACFLYAFTYALVYFGTWHSSTDELGVLIMRAAYMFLVSIGVGHLAREENSRAREVQVIERLNAENAKLMSKNERAARYDKLTGLLNRAYLEKEALREVRKARTADGYLSVLFCDMDKLKRINDELGHDAGDKVLRQVGAALRSKLRQQDLIGRYGGDEFVVVLPNLTRETAYDRADQFIEAVRQVNGGLPESMHVGLSVGVTTYPFDAQDYPTLVKVADQAMYLAKREGGNCVRTANDLRLFWEEMPRPA